MKRAANDLVFIDNSEELLKEAVIILKKSDPQCYQQKILEMVEALSLSDLDDLFQRVRLLKALFLVTKLGLTVIKADD